jgi:hypothetical protein
MNEMRLFNLFGTLVVSRQRITVIAQAVKPDGSAVQHRSLLELETPIEELGETDSCLIVWAALLADNGKKPEIYAYQPTRELNGGPDLLKNPHVRQAVGNIIRKFRT